MSRSQVWAHRDIPSSAVLYYARTRDLYPMYTKYANSFEKEKIGMVELPYLSEERLQEMGVPLGPRLRILQEARISVCKNTVYVI
ncbi:hypothetical protein TSAR_009380 [Trichomalopsis sarcophagae]|uniref:SAM domain-containing protein n=1 Tax=Trichomalopsis sarcophagae TaxID=543379 RepID=A0A232F949_9HYME|nr:hypothetical protein TSAR_009380 [Trichomalopsis sarcophagae]